MFHYVNVFPFLPIYKSLTYKVPDYLKETAKEGVRVVIPFKNKKQLGIIFGQAEENLPEEKIKEIECILEEEPLLNQNLLKLCYEISNYYFSPFGETIKLFFSPKQLNIKEPIVTMSIKGSIEGDEDFLNIFQKPKPLSFFQKTKENYGLYLKYKEKGWIEFKEERKDKKYYITLYSLPSIPYDILIKKAGKSKKKIEILEILKEKKKAVSFGELNKIILVEEDFLNKMARERLILKSFKEKYFFPIKHWIEEKKEEPLFDLTEKQKQIYETIKKTLLENKFKTFLLYGVTASGKSEIYLHLSDYVINNGGKVLILVPEISLTPFLATRAINLWKGRVAIYHSNLSENERNEVFFKAKNGEMDLVVGTRSALFLPLEKLKLIIVDEEQDTSYKQEDMPRYNGRDIAILRGSIENSVVLLASATPSIESMANCEKGKYTLLLLKERVKEKPLPIINIINTKEAEILHHEHGWILFTKPLIENLKKNIEKGNQAILLIPRRGYAPIMLCRVCGYYFFCPNCSLSFTVHRRKNKLICHWCNVEKEIPDTCPNCSGKILESIGIATEKVAEVLKNYLPDIEIGILDRDTLSKREELKSLLFNFELGKTKVLVGTQLVAKGHHFPNVTFIGILNADFLLKFPDFRGPEKLFSLIVQVAGRAGRGEEKGEVFIQTENPNHYAIKLSLNQDFEEFYKKEIHYRKIFNYPPFSSMALLTIHSKNFSKAINLSKELRDFIKNLNKYEVNIKGPYPAPHKKLKNEYRFQFLFRSNSRKKLHNFLNNLKPFLIKKNIYLDLDPINFL